MPGKQAQAHKPALLAVEDLRVSAEGAEILKGITFEIGEGEVHALMGPNGAGKSTLANVLLGHPGYKLLGGAIRLKGEDVTEWSTEVRGKAGLFLAFQHPEALSGVSVTQFLRQAMSARRGTDVSALEVRVAMTEWMERLGMDPAFGERYLNEGFSGGERKRNEILQMALLEPEVAVLDETDSGLDVDALGVVGRGVTTVRGMHPSMGVLVVTHYQRILRDLVPDRVHLMVDGRIVESGGAELAAKIESSGYEEWRA
jgi:Fe-S cluster assembly ATP-binding protein